MTKFYRLLLMMVLVVSYSTLAAQSQEGDAAIRHLNELAATKGYQSSDLQQLSITDNYTSGGITHVYLRQTHQGIDILDATAAVHSANGKVVSSTIQFHHGLNNMKIASPTPNLSAKQAIAKVAQQKNYSFDGASVQLISEDRKTPRHVQVFSGGDISYNEIKAQLIYVATQKGTLQLAWDLAIDEKQGTDYMNYFVDASTGKIIKEVSWTIHCTHGSGHEHNESCSHGHNHDNSAHNATVPFGAGRMMVANSYNVYPWPIESPNFGNRSIVVNPEQDNTTASPNGWHQVDRCWKGGIRSTDAGRVALGRQMSEGWH